MTQMGSLRSESVQSNCQGNKVVNDREVEDLGNNCSKEAF